MQCILVKSEEFENSYPLLYILLKSCLCCCSLATLAAQQLCCCSLNCVSVMSSLCLILIIEEAIGASEHRNTAKRSANTKISQKKIAKYYNTFNKETKLDATPNVLPCMLSLEQIRNFLNLGRASELILPPWCKRWGGGERGRWMEHPLLSLFLLHTLYLSTVETSATRLR